MRKIVFTTILACLGMFALAQKQPTVYHSDKGNYIKHTVAPKESYFSIGRLYNIHPKEIAEFNGLDMDKGLNIGQVIKVPSKSEPTTAKKTDTPKKTDAPVTKKSDPAPAKGTPIYYTVGEKEGLYRVSVKNNGVLMADLRKWNNLKTDNLYPGQKLIVGFAGGEVPESYQNKEVVAIPKDNEDEIKEPEKKDVVVEEKMEEKKPEPVRPVQNRSATNDGNGGYFSAAFHQQSRQMGVNKEKTATSGIFKTGSGWDDAKYYILIDKVEPGTIVKVTNPANNKVVYAKVLEGMSGIRQNVGLDVRISNAAANILDIADTDKFIVKVSY
jgi:LysM repeat protein